MISRMSQTEHVLRRRSPVDPWIDVPPLLVQREALRAAGGEEAAGLEGTGQRGRDAIEAAGRRALERLGLEQRHLGFAMVMVANALWDKALRRVPFGRRLLLLPRCLERIDAEPSEPGAATGDTIQDIRRRAEQLGYHVLVAEGMPAVVQVLAHRGDIDAIVGVACLDSLAAAFDTVWQIGVPAVAVPLLRATCRDTAADMEWVRQFVEGIDAEAVPRVSAVAANGYVALLRASGRMTEPERLERLLSPIEPVSRDGSLAHTGRVARTWLSAGGKRLRPFITLAAAAALADEAPPDALPDAVYRVALAIEAFHKASLVHDDIEDDDETRYGKPTLHKEFGVPLAVNVGDYLLGLGYRLVAATAPELPPATTAAVLEQLSRAHLHLAQGQGAELTWRDPRCPFPGAQDVLKVYALKTAPAFEAALASGVLVGPQVRSTSHSRGSQELTTDAAQRIRAFARYVGVGFQVLNDLSGWQADARAGRPTYLAAMALASAPPDERPELERQLRRAGKSDADLAGLTDRLEQAGACRDAQTLLARLRSRAEDLADAFRPAPLARLCRFLVQVILDRSGA